MELFEDKPSGPIIPKIFFNALETGYLPEVIKSKYYKLDGKPLENSDKVPSFILLYVTRIGKEFRANEDRIVKDFSKSEGFDRYFEIRDTHLDMSKLESMLDIGIEVDSTYELPKSQSVQPPTWGTAVAQQKPLTSAQQLSMPQHLQPVPQREQSTPVSQQSMFGRVTGAVSGAVSTVAELARAAVEESGYNAEGGSSRKLLDYFKNDFSDQIPVLGVPSLNISEIVKDINQFRPKKGTSVEQDFPKSSLIMYDLPSRRIVKYDQKSGKYQLFENGKLIDFDDIDEEKCFGLADNGVDCATKLVELFTGQDATILNQIKSNPQAFQNVLEHGMVGMQPEFAIKILDKFGFQRNQQDESIKFESVQQWIDGLSTKQNINDIELKNITQSTSLLNFLRTLVSYINGNTEILNHHGEVSGDKLSNDPLLKNLNISRYPELPLTPTTKVGKDSFLELANIHRQVGQLRSDPSLFTAFPISVMRGGQSGGSTTVNIRSIIVGLLADLERIGKKLSAKDKNTLMSNIDTLESLESKLGQVGQYLSEYRRWLSIDPEGNKNEFVGMETIESAVHKYRDGIIKQYDIESRLLNVAVALKSKCA